MYSPAERRAHVAGIVDRPTRPEPTKLDYIAALMRANSNLTFKAARAQVEAEHPEAE